MNVNRILITGNLTADSELRYTPNGKAVLSASLANNEYYTDAQGQEQKVTTFVNLEVWMSNAKLNATRSALFATEAKSIMNWRLLAPHVPYRGLSAFGW